MGKPNYRVVVSFDPQRTVFTARAPELAHLSGEGPSRKDAIARLEEEIDAQLANMLSHGSTPPRAIDEVEHSGEVHAKVSRGLHRELVYLANSEGVELDQLVSELLAAALAVRQGARGGQRAARPAPVDHGDDIGNRAEPHHHGGGDRDGNRSDGNRRPFGRGGHSTQLLDDRANFIEYVRGLEQGGGGGGRGPGGHQNRGHNHGGGGNNRRRRGGGGGPGGPPQNREGGRHQGGHRGQQHGRPHHGGGQGPGGGGASTGGQGHGHPASAPPSSPAGTHDAPE